jgi:proteasome lid subunit RPN8/RPN11
MYYIRFSENIKNMMIEHTLLNPTKECGGFLYGNVSNLDDDVFCDVDGIYYEDKVGTDRKFIFGLAYVCRALKKMDLLNMDILGSYHSHGNYPAVFSDEDRDNLQKFFSSNKITIVYSPKYDQIVGEYMDNNFVCHEAKILVKK